MKKLVSLILAIMMIAAVGAAFANGDVDGVLTDGKDGMPSKSRSLYTIQMMKKSIFPM